MTQFSQSLSFNLPDPFPGNAQTAANFFQSVRLIVFQAEALCFWYFRADGVRAGSYNNVPAVTTDDIEFKYNMSPRLTLGYVTNSGLGFRARWWESLKLPSRRPYSTASYPMITTPPVNS